jgi:hypothetical protein
VKPDHSLIVGDGASSTVFACTCGVRGSYEEIVSHVAEYLGPSLKSRGFPSAIAQADTAAVVVSPVPTDDVDFGGGDTKAHYLPLEPKRPALPALPNVVEPLSRDVTWGAVPSYAEPERSSAAPRPSHHVLPEADPSAAPTRTSRQLATPPTSFVEQDLTPAPLPPTPTPNAPVDLAPIVLEPPRSIAELFQDMLRIAYEAGAASAATGEIFETWYQREVLQ